MSLVIGLLAGLTLAAGPPPSERLLAALVAGLGSDDFDTRQESARRLRGHFAAARLLEDALSSEDAEVRSSATKLLEVLAPVRMKGPCGRAARLAAEGRFDLLPDHLYRWARHDEKDVTFLALSAAVARCWNTGLARMDPDHRRRARSAGGDIWIRPWPERTLMPQGDHRVVEDVLDSNEKRSGFYVANSLRIKAASGILTSASTFEATIGGIGAIIVANGDVRIPAGGAWACIIISDGSVDLDIAHVSLVIARKGIRVRKDGRGHGYSVFVAGGKADVPPMTRKTSHVEEDSKRPLGMVRFFEPSDVGLSLDGLSIKSIRPRCPLAAAGIEKGDAFVSIDGKATKTPEELRRALRKRYAIDGLGTFTLKRGDKSLTFRASLGD